MFSYYPIADPNLSHTGFYIVLVGSIIVMGLSLMDFRKLKWVFFSAIIFSALIGWDSWSEYKIPENKEYTAKFIRFVPEQEKHVGAKQQISYTNRIYCEYELTINNQRILMDCNSRQSPEYIKVYWN